MDKISEQELEKRCFESNKKRDLYNKCINSRICPECGNDLISGEKIIEGFLSVRFFHGVKCTNCKFDIIRESFPQR